MSIGISLGLDGLDDLVQALDFKGRAIEAAIERTVRKAGNAIQNEARILVPVDTGLLRSRINAEFPSKEEAVVEADTEYAIFVEFGTGKRGAQSQVTHPADYNYGPSKGMKAQPYLYPAFVKVRDEFADELSIELNGAWV